jgi:hypothetical protein
VLQRKEWKRDESDRVFKINLQVENILVLEVRHLKSRLKCSANFETIGIVIGG